MMIQSYAGSLRWNQTWNPGIDSSEQTADPSSSPSQLQITKYTSMQPSG